MDQLFIKGLVLQASLGVYAFEKQIKRSISLDIEISYDSTAAAKSDALDDALDYDALSQEIEKIVSEQHYQLIETLANKIADYLLKKTCCNIKLTLYKPHALQTSACVGLTVMRSV